MAKIRILPDTVANKIAAGEVVERPASVVKELVENSIDAGASRIDIHIEHGGHQLIRVTDDGEGMDADDVALAFRSHATSKLGGVEDLFAVNTLGFRGEALPSIGAVSQAKIISRRRDSINGWEIEMKGGELGEVKACGAAVGTTVEVRNLFFNVPVRRKFLKSPATEMGHIMEVVTRFSLCYPQIAFNVLHNGRTVVNLPPVEEPAERIAIFFGEDLAQDLINFRDEDEEMLLYGYAAPPHHSRANARFQYIFLNGRYIRDRSILAAISQAYQGMLMPRRFPVVFLFIRVKPELVDVNVHPTKIEVRFRKSGYVYQRVLAALSNALSSGGAGAKLELPERKIEEKFPPQPTREHPRGEEIRRALTDFFERTAKKRAFKSDERKFEKPRHKPPAPTVEREREFAPPPKFVQVHDSYIVEETEDGINIIDQHALHERIIAEELREQMRNRKVASQKLLIPETVKLTHLEYEQLMSIADDLAAVGIEIGEFGENTIVIHSVPQLLRNCNVAELVRDLLDELHESKPADVESRIESIIKVAACKGAVKAGEKLAPEEIEALLRKRDKLGSATTCPHGRPITLSLKLSDLEKQFKRR